MVSLGGIEKRILYDTYGKCLWQLRQQPSHAAHYLTGIFLPPHERLWLRNFFADYKTNNVLASRGTSKSWTHASFAAPIHALLHKNVANLVLSNSGFRGGKELFRDGERMFLGQLKSQIMGGQYLRSSIDGPRIINKDPSLWTMPLRSFGRVSTAPTNNPEQLRGLRANFLVLDERAFMDDELPNQVVRPMTNVGGDFRNPAKAGDDNKIYQVSTIDFSIRGWWKELQVAEHLQQAEYEAAKARKEGDWAEYDRLMNDNDGQLRTASFSYTRVDYTDLIIPEVVNTLDGEHTYTVDYPRDPGIELESVRRYDDRTRKFEFYTYPVDRKGLEDPIHDGTADQEVWLAEQRNIPISASGNVFSYDLIQAVAERPIPLQGPVKRKRAADEQEDSEEEFYAPVLFTCGDPCVLGMDVARESDETTFVVIRLGELAEGEFSPFIERRDSRGRVLLGHTSWNHICWAENHRHMPSHEAAKKVRELQQRYNLVFVPASPGVDRIPAVAMDQKGGGSAVRDDLANPKPDVEDGIVDPNFDWNNTVKIYDPEDTGDGGYAHYSLQDDKEKYWGGLKLMNAQNQDNIDWTFATRGLMQAKKLYIAFFLPPSKWAWEKGLLSPNGDPDRHNPEFIKWEVGYNGIRRLKSQLLRIQTHTTEGGVMRFRMPHDRSKEEGKKDLWAAMIYGISAARAHIANQTKDSNLAPTAVPVLLELKPRRWDQDQDFISRRRRY